EAAGRDGPLEWFGVWGPRRALLGGGEGASPLPGLDAPSAGTKMKSNRLSLLVLFIATSCSGAPPAAPPPAAAPPPPAAVASAPAPPPPPLPGLRLSRTIEPVRYRATLTVVPESDAFEGELDIELSLREPSDFVWLNAAGLNITKASLDAAGKTLN